jgi:hypothetical protein
LPRPEFLNHGYAMNIFDQLAVLSTAISAQVQSGVSTLDCEAWAKKDRWLAASEGLPLVLGARPAEWAGLMAATECAAAAREIWTALAAQLGVGVEEDPPIAPIKLRAAAESLGLMLPPPLAAVLDFLARVLPTGRETNEEDAQTVVLAAQEREILLGAALLLVTRMPERCVNELGYFDSARVATLIREKSLLWFPLAPPSLTQDEIARLIAKWLPPQGSD